MDDASLHGILALVIPIVAIIVFGFVIVAKRYIRHRERMAMIEMGIHPDYPPLDPDEPEPASNLARATNPSDRMVARRRREH